MRRLKKTIKRLLCVFRRKYPLSEEDANASLDFSYIKPTSIFEPPDRVKRLQSILQPLSGAAQVYADEAQAFEDDVQRFILDVTASQDDVTCDQATRALRGLFALSEQKASTILDPKTKMIRVGDFRLVPVLFDFLDRCRVDNHLGSVKAAEYLALLVLNSISCPMENKRLIALEYDGTGILCKLLLKDPSCHIAAIILANLTFSSSGLRVDLVRAETLAKVPLIPTLAYVLRASSLSPTEYDAITNDPIFSTSITPQERLTYILDLERKRSQAMLLSLEFQDNLVYFESTRWCLCVLQNLLRPTKESHYAAHSLIRTGILSHIFRFILVPGLNTNDTDIDESYVSNSMSTCSDDTIPTSDPTNQHPQTTMTITNQPTGWTSQFTQDAALFIVMNLSTVASVVDYLLHETDTVETIVPIIHFHRKLVRSKSAFTLTEEVDKKIAEIQCLKARMTLAYLIASHGYFGQKKRARTAVVGDTKNDKDKRTASRPLTISQRIRNYLILTDESEISCLTELVSNSLQQKSKSGPGGYLSIMFNVKYVLYALRCLLTQDKNQVMIGKSRHCTTLNTLLLKVLAIHSTNPTSTSIDRDAAEYACFSLYLLSNSGFRNSFLPLHFGNDEDIAKSTAARVIHMYRTLPDISATSRHGATQLLLRLKYMIFSSCELSPSTCTSSIEDTNRHEIFDDEMLSSIQNYTIPEDQQLYNHGAEPRFDIFDRQIYGLWMPVKRVHVASNGETNTRDGISTTNSPVDETTYDVYPTSSAGGKIYANALQAVQDISFGSIKYRHSVTKKGTRKIDIESSSSLTMIDDILIANTIANCADAKDNVIDTESYNHTWRWYDSDDNANGIGKLFTTIVDRIPDSSNFKQSSSQSPTIWDNYRTFFTKLCGQDTTV